MTPVGALLLGGAAWLVGILIGCTGIGGFLLTPTLVFVGGLPTHLAMATSVWSFIFTGIVGTLAFERRGSVDWPLTLWLGVGALPAAVLGARVSPWLTARTLEALLAVLIVAVGVHALVDRPRSDRSPRSFRWSTWVLVGGGVGFGSVLTGAGGAALLVPTLTLLRVPVLVTVGASQTIQLGVATGGTIGNVLFGRIDFGLGTALGIVEVLGVMLGARLAHVVAVGTLRRLVAAACIGAGLLILVRALGLAGAGTA